LLTTPGPKMIWQFDERGYDVSINFGGDRVASKPPQWEKWAEQRRKDLYNAYAALINLRISNNNLFNSSNFNYNFFDNGGLVRTYQIADNAANGVKLSIVANMDVVAQTRNVGFQATGNWYNYLSNGTGSGFNGTTNSVFNVSSNNQSVTLQPGEFHVYLYHSSNVYVFNGSGNWSDAANWSYGILPPATLPSGSEIIVTPRIGGECLLNVSQTISAGAKITVMDGKKIRIPLNLNIQ
jgi:hypothetical protein